MMYTLRRMFYPTFLLVLATTSGMAGADVIFDNGGPGLDNAWFSGYATGSWYEDFNAFVLAPGANVITDIHWWGVYNTEPPAEDNFWIGIVEDDGGDFCGSFWFHGLLVGSYLPGPVNREFVLSDNQSLLLEGVGQETAVDLFAYDFVLPQPLTLTPGSTYWLGIVNGTYYVAPNVDWYWESSGAATGNGLWLADGVGCDCIGGGFAFQLTGPRVIPEPASVSLLGVGLLTWSGARLRRHERK